MYEKTQKGSSKLRTLFHNENFKIAWVIFTSSNFDIATLRSRATHEREIQLTSYPCSMFTYMASLARLGTLSITSKPAWEESTTFRKTRG